jgi:hypothetical protein
MVTHGTAGAISPLAGNAPHVSAKKSTAGAANNADPALLIV